MKAAVLAQVAAAALPGLADARVGARVGMEERSHPMAKHVVATVSEIKPGGRKLVEVKGRAIVLFNLSGEFFALSNRCPHQGGSLSQGILTCLVESAEPGDYRTSRQGEIIRCPWHQWEYDIRTGK